MESRRPSLPDIVDIATGSHTLASDPPATRWVDRRVGRALRLFVRKRAWIAWIALSHGLGAGHAWLWAKLLHWLR